MLVLTRKPKEEIIIKLPSGETIDIVLTGVKGNQARIGIEAPPNIDIVRKELLSFSTR